MDIFSPYYDYDTHRFVVIQLKVTAESNSDNDIEKFESYARSLNDIPYVEHKCYHSVSLDEKIVADQNETVILKYRMQTLSLEEANSSRNEIVDWIKEISQEYPFKFSFIYDDRTRRGDLYNSWKYGCNDYQNGECINRFEESLKQNLNRHKQELRNFIIDEFQNMLLPKIPLNKDLKSTLLSFTPYFGLNIDKMCSLEKEWFDINTERMNGKIYWSEPLKKSQNSLFEKLRLKWHQIHKENDHISQRGIKLILEHFFEYDIVKLIEDITGFKMQRRQKCKYYGSAAGCKNGDSCNWSHNNPYVTRKCLYFAFEGCHRGNTCFFRHSESDQEEPDKDSFFDAVEEEPKDIYSTTPRNYTCFICKMTGHHWIMRCPQKKS